MARAARPGSSRLELNFAALNQVEQALAQGLLRFGTAIATEAASTVTKSDDPRYGHIKENWGVAIWIGGKKVGNASYDGSATAKPRAFRTGKGITGIVGFGFPARFLEMGTSDTRAQPFLSPAAQRMVGSATSLIREGAAPYWPKPG